MKNDKHYIMFLWFIIITITILFEIKIQMDIKEINRLEKKVKKQYIEIHDYEWMTQQYKYMFDKYCGGMNNKNDQ